MDAFAFIIHPIDAKRDVSRKFPLLGRILPERLIDIGSTYFPPLYLSEVRGIRSYSTGKEVKGWLLACPYTPRRMLELPEKIVYRKIIKTGQLAESLGANILGLGAYTSVVGDGGMTIASALDIPVTTGDAYTISVALQAVRKAAILMGIHLPSSKAAIVGATGAIGRVCAELLASEVSDLILIGRKMSALKDLKNQLQTSSDKVRIHISTGLEELINAKIILSVTSARRAIIQTAHLQPGCIVCDVSRPRDVSAQVAAARDDVLVIDGGVVDVPGQVEFNFDFGLPPGKAYACMAETIALALDGRFVDFTLGKCIARTQVEEITAIAEKHGFRLSGLRSFEHSLTPDQIGRVRERALLSKTLKFQTTAFD